MTPPARDPLPVENLCTDYQRRPIGASRAEFEQERQAEPADEIGELLDELRSVESEARP